MISLSQVAGSRNRRRRFQLDLFGARPSFQFYPGDWLRNAKLSICSLASQGLWLRMMCIMHQAEPYGHLRIGPQRVDDNILARAVGVSIKDILPLLSELEHAGVFSRESDGTIICRRMISDERIRKSRAAGGIKSLDNPRVPQRKDILEDIHADIHGGPPEGCNAVPSPSSSSSSSSSVCKNDDDESSDLRLEERLRKAGLTRSQMTKALKRGAPFAKECLEYIESPPDGVNPLKIVGACIRDGTAVPDPEPQTPTPLKPPDPISAEDRAKYGAIAKERVLSRHPNLRGTGLSVSLEPAVDREIRAIIAGDSQGSAA